GVESFEFSTIFCRRMDVISRKQGMKGGSVLAHVTDWNDAADEESAPFCRAKRYFLLFFAAEWM
ncbi:MAG: hypothetical protein J6S69_05225, partial [Proteobacteria bacterium]|nr:hypothetical protein [Pseudomonadota bacterium]